MKTWKTLNDFEKKEIIQQSDKILVELKKIVIDSHLFRDNTQGNPNYGHHFLGPNIIIRWYGDITSLQFFLTSINKITNKSFWGTKVIEEENRVYLRPFEKKSNDWDFEDFYKQYNYDSLKLNELEKDFLNNVFELLDTQILKAKEMTKINFENLTMSKNNILNELDKNNDGEVDLIENDFNKLFSKNQKAVIQVDKNYIHQFVKISNFIKTKKQNTQKIFESIRDTSNQVELDERISLLKNQIHSYELLVFHSINMIGALVAEDLITFYEIYESFDKLRIFNSNWENEVSEKLVNIADKLDDLMFSIYNMEQNIVSELSHLTYVTQESFENLNVSVTNQLKDIESSININNLLAGIQTYQLYKINKKTNSLRS